MILLSGMFCGDNHSFDYTPTNMQSINKIEINNGIFDDLYVSKNPSLRYDEADKKWDFDTILYALFKNNLMAGNVLFTAETVSAVKVKRCKKGDYVWDTLFEVPISKNEDFAFERFDAYARGNTEYEYSLVPVMNSIEGSVNKNSIKSEFEGIYLIEKDIIHHLMINAQISSHDRNHVSSTINTLGRKYPFHVSNGKNNYTTGQLQGTFYGVDNNYELVTENSWQYRESVDDFLSNGQPKILKNDEGKMWMVVIVDNIKQDLSQHWNMPIHTISWTEIGNADNVDDLYDNNFIDIDNRLFR